MSYLRSKIRLHGVKDGADRVHAEVLRELLASNPFMAFEGRFIEHNFERTGTFLIEHGLRFVPPDLLVVGQDTSFSGAYVQASADEKNLMFEVYRAGRVRFLVGRFRSH